MLSFWISPSNRGGNQMPIVGISEIELQSETKIKKQNKKFGVRLIKTNPYEINTSYPLDCFTFQHNKFLCTRK